MVVDAACGPAGEDAATDTIALAAGATYSLTIAGAEDLAASGDLDILDNSAAEDLVIAGEDSTIANASTPKDRVLHVLAGADVAIMGVTVSNGLVVGEPGPPGGLGVAGGGILNLGSLRMSDCAVIGNRATGFQGETGGGGGGALGGGIATSGPLVLTDCLVRLNVATGGDGGVPLAPLGTSAGVGSGGGIGVGLEFPPVTLIRSRLEANSARGGAGGGQFTALGGDAGEGRGGAIYAGPLDVSQSVIQDNIAKGGTGGGGSLGFGSIGAFGRGGALLLVTGVSTITATTISGNRAEGGDGGPGATDTGFHGGALGGGIEMRSLLTIANSTLSGNAALRGSGRVVDSPITAGGGIMGFFGQLSLDSVTLTGSAPNGIHAEATHVSITNSIVALPASGVDCYGSPVYFSSNDFNIDSDGSCNFNQPHDQSGVTASQLALGSLADNGGPTQTHEISPTSAAYEHGSTVLTVDQRGIARPQWNSDDVGAFEQQRQFEISEIPVLSPTALLLLGALLALAALRALK